MDFISPGLWRCKTVQGSHRDVEKNRFSILSGWHDVVNFACTFEMRWAEWLANGWKENHFDVWWAKWSEFSMYKAEWAWHYVWYFFPAFWGLRICELEAAEQRFWNMLLLHVQRASQSCWASTKWMQLNLAYRNRRKVRLRMRTSVDNIHTYDHCTSIDSLKELFVKPQWGSKKGDRNT